MFQENKNISSFEQQYYLEEGKYFFFWATIFTTRKQIFIFSGNNIFRKQANTSSFGQQYFPGESKYFLFWATIFPRKQNKYFGQRHFPEEGNSGEKLAEN